MSAPSAGHLPIAADAVYFRSRALEERRLLALSPSGSARRIHREMAEHYEALMALLDPDAPAESASLASALRQMFRRLSGD